MLKAAEDKSSTFTNPYSNSEIVNSFQLRDNLLRMFRRLYYDEKLLSLRDQRKSHYQCEFENKIEFVT